MGSLLLLIAVILIFRALFSSFGFTSSDTENERNKALNEFLENKFGSDVNNKEIKNVYVVDFTKKDNNTDINNIEEQNNTKVDLSELFLKQVEKVVEEIVCDFANNKKEVLKELLTTKMFNVFSNEIDKNIANKIQLRSSVISFEEKKMLTNFDQNSEVVSVALIMKQIYYIEDENKNIIHGSKDNYVIIKEVWNFVKNKDVNISSPWLVDSISEYKN